MTDALGSLTVVFTEFYYFVTVVFMFLIHVGFCMYEVGASRHKNHLHTLMKNVMIIPLVTITFFFFGWWIYFAFPNGPYLNDAGMQVAGGGLVPSPSATPTAPPAPAAIATADFACSPSFVRAFRRRLTGAGLRAATTDVDRTMIVMIQKDLIKSCCCIFAPYFTLFF